MKERIYAALVAKYPTLKTYQAEKAAGKYVDVMLEELANSIRRFRNEDDQISLALEKISARIGRIKVDGKNIKICGAVNSDRERALIHVDFLGNEGKDSRVSINPTYLAEIIVELAEIEPPTPSTVCGEMVPNIHTTVDIGTLDSYIEHTMRTMKVCHQAPSHREKYQQALLRNLLHARHIKASLIEEDGQCLFPEYWEQSDSGRCYGHGTSLQRVSKEVRHAALGRCHMYDFKAASYALMTDLALGIDPTLEVSAIKDYVNRRSHIRKCIAADVGISEEWMKTIFTSLGFGAKVANNPYASIRKTLGEAAYIRLMMNDQFVRIGDAMMTVRDVIAGHYPDSFELYGQHYGSVCPRTGKKRKKDQKLAWIYQSMEAYAIASFGADAVEEGYQPLLFVHDCVYFKHKLPEAVLAKITGNLQQTFPLLEADHDDVHPIHAPDYIDPIYAQAAQEVRDHRERMRTVNGQTKGPTKTLELDDQVSYDGLAHIMSASELSALRKHLAGPYSLGASVDVGRIWNMNLQ